MRLRQITITIYKVIYFKQLNTVPVQGTVNRLPIEWIVDYKGK